MVVRAKPAKGRAGDSVVLLFRLLGRRVCFCAPTPRTTFDYMSVVEEAVEHGGNSSTVAQQFAPVLHRAVGGEQSTGALITPHHDLQQFLSGGDGQLAHAQIVDDEQRN